MKIEKTFKAVAHEACVCEMVKLEYPHTVDSMIDNMLSGEYGDELDEFLHDEDVEDRRTFECMSKEPEMADYPLLGQDWDFFLVVVNKGKGNISNGYLYGFESESFTWMILQRKGDSYLQIFSVDV